MPKVTKNSAAATSTANLSYRQLLTRTKEEKDSANIESDITNASFKMQQAIVDSERQVALAKIEVSQAQNALVNARTVAERNNELALETVPFNPQAILDSEDAGEAGIERAENTVATAERKLAAFEKQLSKLQAAQARLFPAA